MSQVQSNELKLSLNQTDYKLRAMVLCGLFGGLSESSWVAVILNQPSSVLQTHTSPASKMPRYSPIQSHYIVRLKHYA